ncbi:heterokaryon incompatibility protein-domain-containing protein, partial [Phaeosphaeria sp. MPI-PUGE-AT-0046c]
LARSFLKNCQDGHEKCHRGNTTLPSRVIDVGTKTPIKSVRLHWSGDNECDKYAALSYCWGGPQPLNTTFATAQDNTNGIIFSALPQTLQDAMTITLGLGLRYIWIDSLCIVQDDPDDLNREIANMANIYRGAFVAISAARASSVHHGFLADQSRSQRARIALPFRSTSTKHGTIYLEQSHRAYDPEEDPINLRAWTLQEHILPHRMLIFGTREMWWTCEGAVGFDSTWSAKRGDEIPAVQHKTSPDRYSIDYWRSIVRDYTRRFLTFPYDKLSAIAGVADLYSQFFNSRYLAGLWGSSLLEELMWCSVRTDISRPLARRAPSWSWASVDGEVHHHWCTTRTGSYATKIIKCDIHLVSDASPFGPVDASRCVLHVEGKLIKAFWQSDRKYISTVLRYRMDTEFGTEEVKELEVYGEGGRTHADALESDTLAEVWVLPITADPVRGLLLAHVEGNTYRRVGLVSRMWSEPCMPSDPEIRKFSII